MNFFAAFQSEVFRPLVTLLIPGGLATSSWLVALCLRFPKLRVSIATHSAESYIILFLAVTATGIILEDLGAKIEIRFDNAANKRSDDKFDNEWYAYLRTAFVCDPIGRGYLRTLVLRLKFQLGILLGSSVAGVGLLWLLWLGLPLCTGLVLLGMAIAIAAWHYRAAKEVHETLGKVRHELGQEIRIVGGK